MSERKVPSPARAYALLTGGAFFISFSPILVKLVGDGTVGLTAIAFWRTLIGGAILFLLTAGYRKPLALPKSVYPWSALAGFMFFIDLFVWHRSIMYAGAGLSTILGNTQVFFTAILGYLIFRERLSYKFFVAAFLAIVGIVLLVGVFSATHFSNVYIHGIIFGLITGVAYASYLITLKHTGRREVKPDFLTFVAWTSLFSAIFLGIASIFESGRFLPPTLYAWFILFLLALIVQALGWWAIYSSLSYIEASRAGLILLLQPTLATDWGVIIFAEYLSISQVAGAVVTLGAIYYGSTYKR